MSGGRWQYIQDRLAEELFGYGLYCDYGEEGHKQKRIARSMNPMEDRELSELVWDVLCLIHSCDWYRSGDTDEETYRKDVRWFKKKWLKRTESDAVEEYKQDLRDFANQLINEMEQTIKGERLED